MAPIVLTLISAGTLLAALEALLGWRRIIRRGFAYVLIGFDLLAVGALLLASYIR